MSNKLLAIIFAVLLGIYLLSQVLGKSKETNIDRSVFVVDTATISKIVIHPKSNNDEMFTISRMGGKWQLEKGGERPSTNQSSVVSLLRSLSTIQVDRLVSKSKDRWEDYEVSEDNGTRIQLFDQSRKLKDLVIGRFSFNQATRSATSYIRSYDQPDIFSVDGFLSMTLGQGYDAYRNKSLLKLDPSNLTQILFRSSDAELPFTKVDDQWLTQGAGIDSLAMVSYVNSISNLSGTSFYDESDFSSLSSVAQLTFTSNDRTNDLIDIRSSGEEFVLHSSMNETSHFTSDSSGIFKRLVTDLLNVRQ